MAKPIEPARYLRRREHPLEVLPAEFGHGCAGNRAVVVTTPVIRVTALSNAVISEKPTRALGRRAIAS